MKKCMCIWCSIVFIGALLLVSGCGHSTKKVEVKMPMASSEGVFVNQELGFSVEYPAEKLTVKAPVKPPLLLNVVGPKKLPSLMILAVNKPAKLPLEKSGILVVGLLKKSFPKSQRHKLLKQEIITLENGKKANYIEMKWKYDRTLTLITTGTVAYKNEKAVIVIASNVPTGLTPISVLESWVKTLKFYN